jgi:hypothetical protein
LPRWGQLAGGTTLLAIALAAGTLGLVLNVAHGLEAGLAPAIAFGLADGAKLTIPLVAGLIGWSRQMRITAAICVAVSIWSAVNVYLDGAGRELLAAEHGQATYADAGKRIAELEAEAASLRDLAAREGARGGCKQNCRALTQQAAESAQRLQEARTQRAVLQPVEASGMAATIAMAFGARQDGVARGLGTVKAVLFLLLIEVLVWLAVPAMGLLGQSTARRQANVIDLQPISETPTIAATPVTAAKAGTKAYFLERLQREFPALAQRVGNGEMSVFAASVEAGLRKAPKAKLLALPSA